MQPEFNNFGSGSQQWNSAAQMSIPINVQLELDRKDLPQIRLTDDRIALLIDEDPFYSKVVNYIPKAAGDAGLEISYADEEIQSRLIQFGDYCLRNFVDAQIRADSYGVSHLLIDTDEVQQNDFGATLKAGTSSHIRLTLAQNRLVKQDGFFHKASAVSDIFRSGNGINESRVIEFKSRADGASLIQQFHKYWNFYRAALVRLTGLLSRKDFVMLRKVGLEEDLQASQEPNELLQSILTGAYRTIESEGILAADASYDANIIHRDLSSVSDVCRELKKAAIGASGLPEKILLGSNEHGGGLGDADQSDRQNLAQSVDSLRTHSWLPKLIQIFNLLALPDNETRPTIELTGSLKLTPSEQANLYYQYAQADQIYLQNGVVLPVEIRSRLVNGWTESLTLDPEAFDKAIAQVKTQPVAVKDAAVQRVIKWGDYAIGVELMPGDVRWQGQPHERFMTAGYGHIRGYKDHTGDKEALDVYLPHEFFDALQVQDWKMFVVDQTDVEGHFDEHKIILADTIKHAKRIYLAHMPIQYFGGIKEITPTEIEEQFSNKPIAQ